MIYQNYIWDFDGTIFDSYPHILASLFKVFEEQGTADQYDREMRMRHLLVSFGEMKRYTGISDEVYAAFSEHQLRMGEDEIEPKVVPFADAAEVLAKIRENGGRNFLYTHRNLTSIEYVRNFGLFELFDGFVTSADHVPSKPAPDAVLAIIDRYGLDPKETIMVGDREIDGMSGVNAGIDGALVNFPPCLPDGTSPADKSVMKYKANSLTEFAKIVGIL